jgi:hypothetical protein
MADGLWLVPVEAEVTAGNGEVCRDSQLFAPSRNQQRAVVADAQAKTGELASVACAGYPRAYLAD